MLQLQGADSLTPAPDQRALCLNPTGGKAPRSSYIGRVTGGRTSPLNSTLTQEIWDAIAETNVIVFINFGTKFTRKKVVVSADSMILCPECAKTHLRASKGQKICLGSLALAIRGGKGQRVG